MNNKKRNSYSCFNNRIGLNNCDTIWSRLCRGKGQMQVEIQEDSFRTGELTQPSQKTPENVVKDALKEKTEHALSPKQVSGDEGVNYEVVQKRGSYDGTTLVRMQQIYEGKEVYGHQLTAHVDKKGIIKVFQEESGTKFNTRNLKNPINLSKEEDAKQVIYTKYGNDIKFISDPEVKEVIFVNEDNGQASNAYQVYICCCNTKLCIWNY